ncbi:MAG: outer membrane beta-barrel protein [Gammaproteobacteria bacterium]
MGLLLTPPHRHKLPNSVGIAGAGFGSSDDDILDETGDALKLFAGYRFRPNLAVEAAFVDLGKVDVLIFPDALKQDGLAIELVATLPIGDKGAFFGKAGFFNWEVGAFGVTDDGTDETFGIGGEYRFGNNWAVRVEWQRFNNVSGGDIDLISASVLYSFQELVPRQRKWAALYTY